MRRTVATLAAIVMFVGGALAQAPAEDLGAAVGAFVQPSNAERLVVLHGQIRRAGFTPVVETFAGRDGVQGSNVVFTIGDGPRELLLVAHYDAVKLADGSLSHGVVDNAASVVAVIEAAKKLRGQTLRHRVRVILFDQEELGLIGAKKWIEAHGLANVAAVVNSDVAGYGDTMMYGLNNGAQSAFVVRAVREVCAERALACVSYPSYPPSDDRAFSAAGAPVVSLGFQDEIGAHQMWLAFNARETSGLAQGFVPKVFTTIHSSTDTMAAVDPKTIALAAETYAAVIARLDRAAP
jgi:Zn-dependent M28 family amino/carboxypeptidase